MSGEFVISSVLSHCNKNEATDQRYSPWTDQCYTWSMLQLSFIQKVKENTSLRLEGRPTQKDTKRREAPRPIWGPLFIYFLLPLGLPYVNWAS